MPKDQLPFGSTSKVDWSKVYLMIRQNLTNSLTSFTRYEATLVNSGQPSSPPRSMIEKPRTLVRLGLDRIGEVDQFTLGTLRTDHFASSCNTAVRNATKLIGMSLKLHTSRV